MFINVVFPHPDSPQITYIPGEDIEILTLDNTTFSLNFFVKLLIEFSISSGDKNLNDQLNLQRTQITIEQTKITVAALLK